MDFGKFGKGVLWRGTKGSFLENILETNIWRNRKIKNGRYKQVQDKIHNSKINKLLLRMKLKQTKEYNILYHTDDDNNMKKLVSYCKEKGNKFGEHLLQYEQVDIGIVR